MKALEIAFTGTPVTNMLRARAFYEGVLGLKPSMESAGGAWVEYELGTGVFGIGCYGEAWKPSSEGTCLALEMDDLDAAVSELKFKEVKFAMDVVETPVCRFAIVLDPNGNKVMIERGRGMRSRLPGPTAECRTSQSVGVSAVTATDIRVGSGRLQISLRRRSINRGS